MAAISELDEHYRPTIDMPAFDGSATLSARTITSAMELFSGRDAEGKSISEPIKRSELSSLLHFLEAFVAAKAVSYDGTVDPEIDTEIKNRVHLLNTENQKRVFNVGTALPDYADRGSSLRTPDKDQRLYEDLWIANRDFTLSVKKFALDPIADKALVKRRRISDESYEIDDAPHRIFFAELEDLKSRLANRGESAEREEAEIAAREYFDPFGENGKNEIQGNKCLASIALGGWESVSSAWEAYQSKDEELRRKVSGALINRFRLPYVNRVAQYNRAAHFPNFSLKGLSDRNLRLFCHHVFDNLAEEAREKAQNWTETKREIYQNTLAGQFDSHEDLPPIGLILLLTASLGDDGTPEALARQALKLRKSSEPFRSSVEADYARLKAELRTLAIELEKISKSHYRNLKTKKLHGMIAPSVSLATSAIGSIGTAGMVQIIGDPNFQEIIYSILGGAAVGAGSGGAFNNYLDSKLHPGRNFYHELEFDMVTDKEFILELRRSWKICSVANLKKRQLK